MKALLNSPRDAFAASVNSLMPTNANALLDDAHLLYERAQTHMQEFNGLLPPWQILENHDSVSNEWTYTLTLDRQALRLRKPIAGDIANNLVHALDQVLAACARVHGSERSRHHYYPIAHDDVVFERRLRALANYVDPQVLEIFRSARSEPFSAGYLAALKDLSNGAKHWRLIPTTSSAAAVGLTSPASRILVDVPKGHFDQESHLEITRSRGRLHPLGTELLVGFQFEGIEPNVPTDPMTIFTSGARQVRRVIDDVASLLRSATTDEVRQEPEGFD